MKRKLSLLLTALLVSILFASMLGGNSAGASLQATAGVRWQATIKLQPEASRLALQDRSTWMDSMRLQGISAGLQNDQLSLQGQKDMAQISTALFDTVSPWSDFLSGPIEMTIQLPSNGESLTLNLEARSTTGYRWDVLTGDGVYLQDGEPTFSMRYQGRGVPSIQTIRLSAARTGDTSIQLVYHQRFVPNTEPHAKVSIWMTSAVRAIDLSDPTPQVITVKESSQASNADPYAELNEIKTALPASFDWRTQGIVPPVRNQGGCGSCWAFGTVGVMESAIKKGGGPLTDLSEQFLISCNKDGWDCGGGWTATKYHYDTLGYNQTVAGAVLETAKPYTQTKGTCTVAYSHPYKASDWSFIVPSETTMPTVDQIKNAIYTYGPITAGVCADDGWDSYSGGVYNPSSNGCPWNGNPSTNHQIVLVGWDNATSSWILRNSWGPGWGESGYMRIRWDTTGTKSRVGEGTSWVKYGGGGTPGFNSTFNGSSAGWSAAKGAWSIYSAMYYRSTGLSSKFASAKHTGTYGNFTYEVRMKRTGETNWSNSLIIRGLPTSFDSIYFWKPSYVFQYSNNGKFSVFEITSAGTAIALKDWTASSAIIKNGWNTLKVVANGSSLKYYINGTLVWSGSDSTRLSGQVGFGFYRDATAGTLLVDWAKLTTIADINPFEEMAPGVEIPGGTINMAP